MSQAIGTVPSAERARFLVIFDVARDQVDMEALRERLLDILDVGGFAWDFTVDFAPGERGQQ